MGSVGFYGKLPAYGDFLSRGLSEAFVERWDEWLARCMVDAERRLAQAWHDVYLSSPIWRFAIGPGTCGSSPVLGIVMPSVDRVGRSFPFSVVYESNLPNALIANSICGTSWLDEVEALALAALDDERPDLDGLMERLEALCPQIAVGNVVEHHAVAGAAPGGGSACSITMSDEQPWSGALLTAIEAALHLQRSPYSLWWTEGSERVGRAAVTSIGLPEPRQFLAMMTGDWTGRDGWRAATVSSGWTRGEEPAAQQAGADEEPDDVAQQMQARPQPEPRSDQSDRHSEAESRSEDASTAEEIPATDETSSPNDDPEPEKTPFAGDSSLAAADDAEPSAGNERGEAAAGPEPPDSPTRAEASGSTR